MDYTVHGILWARIVEWEVFLFSRGSSQSRDWTQVSRIAGGFFTSWAMRIVLERTFNLDLFIDNKRIKKNGTSIMEWKICPTYLVATEAWLYVRKLQITPKLLWMVTVATKLKDVRSLEEKLESILKSKAITLLTWVCRVKALVFPVVMYRCESWTIKKA